MANNYTIDTHKHRLAAWAAGRASSAVKGYRFPVSVATEILEQAGFTDAFSLSDLPTPQHMDTVHQTWRMLVIDLSTRLHDQTFTHGIAAKLINCYMKVRFVCGGDHEDARVHAIHPPIDRLLLQALAKQDVRWKPYRYKAWSTFSSDDYQTVIDLIRETIPDRPLWEVEEYWIGYQEKTGP